MQILLLLSQGRILLGHSEIALNQRDILASNGVIHMLDGIFIPPSIVPILPHRCNEESYQIVEVSQIPFSPSHFPNIPF